MSDRLSDARLEEIRQELEDDYPENVTAEELLAEVDRLRAENERLRRLTSYGIQVSVDVSTDDDPYARLWGRTAGWNYSDDGPVLLVEMEENDDA